jgi:hypothetical protein
VYEESLRVPPVYSRRLKRELARVKAERQRRLPTPLSHARKEARAASRRSVRWTSGPREVRGVRGLPCTPR